MIITIKNDDGIITYDVTKIEDEQTKVNAQVTINKVGTLETVLEALNFASATHRGNLEALLKDTPEAVVESEEENVDEETSTEES
jgi:hypothetical protein